MIAFIPARGGSKRLPRKALADLGGKPLIAWTIEAAQKSGAFSDIIVSSDDVAVRLAVQEAYPDIAVWPRPLELAGDGATIADVLRWFRGIVPGAVTVLLPTSPFRTPETIRSAVGAFGRRACEQLLSVVPYAHPPQWALIRKGLYVEPAYPALFESARGALTDAWHHDGSYWIVGGPGVGTVAFETPAEEVCDINTQRDLDWARWTLYQRHLVAKI